MLLVNILTGTTTFIALALCLFIFIGNSRKRENISLAVLLFSVFLWLLANLLTNLSPTVAMALFFGRSTLVGAALIPPTFLLFIKLYLNEKLAWQTFVKWGLVPLILLIATPTNLNISSIEVHGLQVKTGMAYYLMVIELLVYFGLGLTKLYKRHRDPHASPIQKAQIQYMFAGMIITIIPAVFINAILPMITTEDTAILYGPNFIIIFAIFTVIAIVKHQLLDIRLLVARFLAYVLLLGSLVSAYVLIVFVLAKQIKLGEGLRFIEDSIPFLAAIFIALSFHPLKKFFDWVSNKYFYQDAYEPQDLLNELNNLLVSQIELDKILKDGAQIIQKYLKAFYVQFYIDATEKTEAKLVSVGDTRGSDAQKAVHGIWQHANTKLLVVDELPEEQSELRRQLLDQDIAVIARFLSSTQQGKEVGYLILGIKRSGSMYNKQDIRMVGIMADELVIAIQNALRFEEIQQFNITLQQKIDDATHQLRRANEKLKALDETKDEFISMASHQLRTPLTSVKGYVSMVLEGDAGKVTSPQKKLLDQAFMSSQRMVYLIADLLNVSRLRTGKFVIDAQPTNLADLVEGEINQLTETAKGRGLELTYNKPKDFPALMLDETKTRQVIMNFADNAIYYTPSGGHISVNLAETPESIEFTVVDDGLGVPKHDQHHMFTKFFRAGNAKKARPDGTGLGLFMAKKVVIAQGGAIIFRSEEGNGSTFGFSFPKAKLKVNSVAPQLTNRA